MKNRIVEPLARGQSAHGFVAVAKWGMRAALLAFPSLLSLGSNCQDPYKTNPNLILLYASDRAHAFNPVPSPDGRMVYFLEDTTEYFYAPSPFELSGDLCVLSLSDSSVRQLLRGRFYTLALSPEGGQLLLAKGQSRTSKVLIVTDTSLSNADSLIINHPESEYPVQFRWRGTQVVYNLILPPGIATRTVFYAKSLSGDTTTSVLMTVPWRQRKFDIFASDSIFADSMSGPDPAINSRDHSLVVFSQRYPPDYAAHDGWCCFDRETRRIARLPGETRPYAYSQLFSPTWMSEGGDLVFAASKTDNGGRILEPFQLWALRNAADCCE